MIIDTSSDSSSDSSSNSLESPELRSLFEEILRRAQAFRATPLDYFFPRDPSSIIPSDLRYLEQMAAGEHGDAPEEVQTRGRARRPCRFSHYLNGDPEEYREFCETYRIPADVTVRAGPTSRGGVGFREGELTLPLMAIIEGGVRFPLNPLLRRFLRALSLTTSQITVNTYRVISAISELRCREMLPFGLSELFLVYKLSRSGNPPRYYLSSRPDYLTLLIEGLPDSDEWADVYVCVSGNFMFGPNEVHDTPVQFDEGTPGLCSVFCFAVFLSFQLLSHLIFPVDLITVCLSGAAVVERYRRRAKREGS